MSSSPKGFKVDTNSIFTTAIYIDGNLRTNHGHLEATTGDPCSVQFGRGAFSLVGPTPRAIGVIRNDVRNNAMRAVSYHRRRATNIVSPVNVYLFTPIISLHLSRDTGRRRRS